MAYPSPSPGRPIRVLVVDDSAFMRHAIERLLAGIPGAQSSARRATVSKP